jgi:hypothetical protein
MFDYEAKMGWPISARAFSGEVEAGSPPENAITQREIERIPIPPERNSL